MKGVTFLFFLLTVNSVTISGESILNWIWSNKEESATVVSEGVPLVNIPYEMLTEDEKFLKEASKLVTDIQIASPLEICQHKVVMKIKTSCSSMTEEHLAKLSVNLLNCQSETEGRKTFPCNDDMTIKQCTTNMDPDTWNAYHLMSNRARAVCYAARSHQFRALTELTVNKLMQSAHNQIRTLESLKESQNHLEEQTINAHKIIESNIQDLADEKALIRSGHDLLAAMAEDIQKKLDKANLDLTDQAEARNENHLEILTDLKSIQSQAELLWEKIESSTNRIIEQNQDAAQQYEETLMKLEKINQTIIYIYELTNNMRFEVDKKLGWITEYIGTTGENLEKIYRITLHVIYLIGAMIVAAFLQAPFLTRSAILGVIPLNLASYLKHGFNACLDFVSLTVLIILITAMHYLMNGIQFLLRSRGQEQKNVPEVHYYNGTAVSNGHKKHDYDIADHCQIRKSLGRRISENLSSWLNNVNQQIHQSIENLKAAYLSTKFWVHKKFTPTEELSCTYQPARKYNEKISDKSFPSISDDSEYSDMRDSGRFMFTKDNQSLTGAVLRRKHSERPISPLTAFFKGSREQEPKIRETIHIRQANEIITPNVTPISKPACGAKTRSGNPCKLVASKGQNYCHRHATGSSVLGD